MPTSAPPPPAHPVPPQPPQPPHLVHPTAGRPFPPGSPLLTYIHARFREVLGEPFCTLERDSQWSLRSRPEAPAIFVLVNGSYEKPAVWIFDPFTPENVWRVSITSNEEVESALVEIARRTSDAAATDSRA